MDWFSLFPEDCMMEILTRTSPRDVSRSSVLSHRFKSVADSDAVWGKFLPSPDHIDIALRAQSPVLFSTNKQLYLQLADQPFIRDSGTTSFAIEKNSGKKCYTLGARELILNFFDYSTILWKWISVPGSRFSEVVMLKRGVFFEIMCKIETQMLSPHIAYVAFLVYKLVKGPFVFGRNSSLATFCFLVEWEDDFELKDPRIENYFYLDDSPSVPMAKEKGKMPKGRNGGWFEVELGEFFNNPAECPRIDILLLIDFGDLIIDYIELRPKVIA